MSYSREPFKIFVVEDDPAYTRFLEYVLSLNPDFEIKVFKDAAGILSHLHEQPSLITLDYTLPDASGEELLQKIRNQIPHVPVIIISAQEKIGTAVQLLKLGAYDYITKDEETKDRLLNAINNARQNQSLLEQINHLKQEISQKYEFDKSIIGTSDSLIKVFKLLEKAINTNIIVSITGETGTGKELAAKAIHYNSRRKKEPFVAVNIAAIPSELIESELFGHEKGAFTGAVTRRIGKFEEASGGTIFLDEIGEMDLNLQAKLLRVLQEREVIRIGGNEVVKLDVRVIAATHRDLATEVNNGRFREDLYYRLLGLPIHLPPLRERGHDIILLARHFLDQFVKDNQLGKIKISGEAQKKLLSYSYPGNIRELKSIIDLAAVLSDGNEIGPNEIQFNSLHKENNFIGEEMTLKAFEYKIIRHFLDKYEQNVPKVAEILDIGKSTLYRYLKEMEVLGL
jgi:DNA-binding NtrC family response regulator